MTAEEFLGRLESVRSRGHARWSARCPAHADRSPSLSICQERSKILVHCFSGCTPQEIVEALGLTMADLFTDSPTAPGPSQRPTGQKVDLADVAFRFELGALDRRLRAERVLNAAGNFTIATLSEQDLDRLMNVVACAYADLDRAEFLELVADDIRAIAYRERTNRHAA